MDLLISVFNTILYRPLFNILVLLYEYLPGNNFGIAIIALTFLIKLIFYPLGIKGIKSQKALSTLQPKIKEIQQQYKDNKGEQTKAIMKLYKTAKVNPFSGCLPLLVQFPVLIALYRVFWRGLQPEQMSLLYNFVAPPGEINFIFLGIINLSQPNLVLAVFAGIFQFFQVKMSVSKIKPNKKQKSDFSGQMQKQMQYFFPFFTILILFRLPSAIGLYWITTTLFTIIQQYFVFRKKTNDVLCPQKKI